MCQHHIDCYARKLVAQLSRFDPANHDPAYLSTLSARELQRWVTAQAPPKPKPVVDDDEPEGDDLDRFFDKETARLEKQLGLEGPWVPVGRTERLAEQPLEGSWRHLVRFNPHAPDVTFTHKK